VDVVKWTGTILGGAIVVVLMVVGPGCRRDDPPAGGGSPRPDPSGIAADSNAARSPAAQRWDGFEAYPAARTQCTQHVDGFTGGDKKQMVHFTWSAYVTTDSREDVIAFYETAHKSLAADRSGGGFTLRTTGGANLSVHVVGTGAYPKCQDAPRAGERTVIIVGGPRTPTKM